MNTMKRSLPRYIFDELEIITIVLFFSLMVIITGFTVFSRYFMAFTFTWAEQATRIFFVVITFAGISQAAKRGSHLKVTALLMVVPEKIAALLIMFGEAVSAVFAVVMSYQIFLLVLLQIRRRQTFSAIPGLPMWVMYLPGSVFLLVFAVRIVQYGLIPAVKRNFAGAKGGEQP